MRYFLQSTKQLQNEGEITLGSLEELFVRIEFAGKTNKGSIQNWLSDNGKRNKSSYANISSILAEPFEIREQVKQTEEVSELQELKRQSQKMGVADNKTENIVQAKIDKIENELATLSGKRKEERLKEEAEERRAKAVERRKEDIQSDINNISSSRDINKIKGRIDNLDDEADVSDLRSQIEGIQASLEQQRREIKLERAEEKLESDDKRKRANARRVIKKLE